MNEPVTAVFKKRKVVGNTRKSYTNETVPGSAIIESKLDEGNSYDDIGDDDDGGGDDDSVMHNASDVRLEQLHRKLKRKQGINMKLLNKNSDSDKNDNELENGSSSSSLNFESKDDRSSNSMNSSDHIMHEKIMESYIDSKLFSKTDKQAADDNGDDNYNSAINTEPAIMATSLVEVQLPISYKIRNIEMTKKLLEDRSHKHRHGSSNNSKQSDDIIMRKFMKSHRR